MEEITLGKMKFFWISTRPSNRDIYHIGFRLYRPYISFPAVKWVLSFEMDSVLISKLMKIWRK